MSDKLELPGEALAPVREEDREYSDDEEGGEEDLVPDEFSEQRRAPVTESVVVQEVVPVPVP